MGPGVMNREIDYSKLFEAILDAREAYCRLQERGQSRTDQELARDPDYQRLHRSGVTIALIGGERAIESAIQCFGGEFDEGPDAVKWQLSRLWCGMGRWRH